MTHDDLLAMFGQMFSRLDENDYRFIEDPAVWQDFITSCDTSTASDVLAAPLPYERYRAFVNAIFTPGIPGSVLPVESLYKPWSEYNPEGIGSNTGYYLGDHARHIIALCEDLHIAIPEDFKATPDHLALLLELLAFLQAEAPRGAAQDFAAHHLDWLSAYRQELDQREQLESDDALARSIHFYRE